MKIRNIVAAALIILSFIFSCWLSIGVILIGGINSAISGFELGNIQQGVWGIIRAFFFELGFIPFWIGYISQFSLVTSARTYG